MNKSNYNKKQRYFARLLRNNSTLGEIILWSKALRSKKMKGYQFNRQFPMKFGDLNIIVDFICRKLKLIIEVDGYSHRFKVDQDKNRDNTLTNSGYSVLRISEYDVKFNFDNTIRVIEAKIEEIELQALHHV